jgi:hypothetical protein
MWRPSVVSSPELPTYFWLSAYILLSTTLYTTSNPCRNKFVGNAPLYEGLKDLLWRPPALEIIDRFVAELLPSLKRHVWGILAAGEADIFWCYLNGTYHASTRKPPCQQIAFARK